MELPAASLGMVLRAQDGRMIQVDDDVLNVVRDLQQIDPRLKVRWSEVTGHFALYEQEENGDQHLVTTCTELDQRLVERVREISDSFYDYAREIELVEQQAVKQRDTQFSEEIGERGERLAHAIRSDLGFKRGVVVP